MIQPARLDEATALATFLREQVEAVRTAAHGLTDEETLEQTLQHYDVAAAALIDAVATSDPGADAVEAPAPWFGRFEPTPVTFRMLALHLIEEFARHAGHADIVREQLDGALAGQLSMAVHDIAGNEFIQPWSRQASASSV